MKNQDKVATKTTNTVFKHFNEFPKFSVKGYLTKQKYEEFVMKHSPMRPIKSQESFLFRPGTETLTISDGWFWGESDTRANDEGVHKTRFYISFGSKKDKRWTRMVYYMPGVKASERIYLIIYQGDVEFASTAPFNDLTNKKVLEKIKAQRQEKPQKVYQQNLGETMKELDVYQGEIKDKYEQVYSVKNLQQIYNIQHNERLRKEIGPDMIVNILEIRAHFDNYIHEFKLVPELQLIVGTKECVEYCERLLDYSRSNTDAKQCLSYDTSFNLGDFFVSVLTIRNVFMKENCVFPMFFHITETKREKRHCEFFFWMNNNFNLKNIPKLPICSDREKGIYKSILYNDLNLCLCSLHLIRDVKFWNDSKLKKGLINTENAQEFIRYIEGMLNCDTEDKFKKVNEKFYDKFKKCQIIIDYYDKHLKTDISKYSAKFAVKQYAIFKTDKPTTNQSESFNNVMKQATDHKEVPIDKILLLFYNLQNYYINEFDRSTRGLGQYEPNSSHPKKWTVKVKEFSPIDTIIKNIIENKNLPSSKSNPIEIKNSDRTVALKVAQKLITDDALKWAGKYFTCESYNKQDVYMLSLNPKPKCSCGMKTTCAHLIALMMKMGVYEQDKKSKVNLFSFIKSKRKTKGGQKHFRKIDKELRTDKFLNSIILTDDNDSLSEGEKHISINLSDKTSSNKKPLSPLSDSETVHQPNYIIRDRNQFYEELVEKSKTIISNPNLCVHSKLRRRKIRPIFHLSPWAETEIDDSPFVGNHECLKPGQWLFSTTIDEAIKALISELFYEDIASYLGIWAVDNILFNNLQMIHHYAFAKQLLNKNIIFINIHSNNIAYLPKDHFFLAIICFNKKMIIILDSLSKGKQLKNYSLTYMALLNLIKYIHSTNNYMNFNVSEWQLIISSDCAQQTDTKNCGLFVICNVACILKKFQLDNLDNSVQARFWVKNLIERNIEIAEYGAVVPDTYQSFTPISFNDFLELQVIDTDELLGKLMADASTNFYSSQCSFNNCSGSNDRRYICCKCRLFYHNSHDCFAKINDPYFKICKNCHNQFLFSQASAPISE